MLECGGQKDLNSYRPLVIPQLAKIYLVPHREQCLFYGNKKGYKLYVEIHCIFVIIT